jgi:phage FluMu gp28-like protein
MARGAALAKVAGPNGKPLKAKDVERQRMLTASDIVAPLPDVGFVSPQAAANDDGLPILLGYQAKWVQDDAKVKVAEKSRRIGLTWAEAFDCVTIAGAARSAGGMNCFYIGYNLDMAREFIAACAMWAKAAQGFLDDARTGEFLFRQTGADGKIDDIRAFRISFRSGFSIVALPSRPRSLRGMQGVVILDEGAFHDDLPGMLKAAFALLIWGGKVRVISTHLGADNAFNALVEDIRAERLPYSLHRITFDDAIADGLGRRVASSGSTPWTEEWQAGWRGEIFAIYKGNEDEELNCIPALSGGVYLPLSLQLTCVNKAIKVVRWEFKDEVLALPEASRQAEIEARCREELQPLIDAMDPDAPSYYGADFGRSANRTTLWPGQLTRSNFLSVPFLLELYNCPFFEHRVIFKWIAERLPRFTAAKQDANGNGADLAEYMRSHFGAERVEEIKASLDWYRVHWPPAKARLEDRSTEIPDDRDTQEDLRQVKVVNGVPVIPKSNAGSDKAKKKRHGDAAIAYLMLCTAARAEPFMVGYETPSTHPRDRFEPKPDGDRFRMRADEDDDEFSAATARMTI